MLRIMSAAALCLLSVLSAAADGPRVVLGGDVGRAAASCAHRFLGDPFNSLPWLRADLTGEKISEFDDEWDHPKHRPFKNYSGDISGRFIEIMAMDSRGDLSIHPALKGLLRAVSDEQRAGGYLCASGVIDWQQPIDFRPDGGMDGWGRMMPALWGNARLLCGLVEAARAFPDDTSIAGAARRLGDFYIEVLPRFNDPDRLAEYAAAGSYAAGYVTCWFPAMEGLVKLSRLTGERKYLEAAAAIAGFYRRFDRLPIDHAHGMLCSQVSLLLLYEATKEPDDLARVEKRWEELVRGGYINPAGGILEKCYVRFARDEGCAIVDWLRLNLALGRVTGKARYWAMAERTLHNHFLQNQTAKGGFGHRRMLGDENGVYGFGREIEESTWCCTYHGELGFINLREHLLAGGDGTLTCRFALDFTAKDGARTTTSVLRPGLKAGEMLRQRISLAGRPEAIIRIRKPLWADTIAAVDPEGASLPLAAEDGWCATAIPVTDVEFVYSGGVFAEDRHFTRLPDGPRPGEPFVLGYGPKLLAAEASSVAAPKWPSTLAELEAKGLRLFSDEFRRKDCYFVFGLGQ